MDAQMLKAQKRASSFGMNIKFVRSVILGPSTTNHDNNPQMGCMCYYCKKHWQKMGGPPCYKRPRYVKYRTGALKPNLASALQMPVRVTEHLSIGALFDHCYQTTTQSPLSFSSNVVLQLDRGIGKCHETL